MSKRRGRRRRKEPSGGELVPGLIVVTAIFLYIKGVSFDTVVWYLMMGVAILLTGYFTIWFVRGMVKSTEPIDLKTSQSKSSRTKPAQQEK